MKRKTIVMQTLQAAIAACTLLIGTTALTTACSDDVLTGQPTWLGNSIYERLQEDGNYTVMLRLIDDMGQHDVLSRTGSKTLFVADDDAYAKWFKQNAWGVSSYEQLTPTQKRLLLNNAMVNNAYLIELLSNTSGNPPQTGMCMRRATASKATDSIPTMLPADMPGTLHDGSDAWGNVRQHSEGIRIQMDASDAPMIHFLPAYMRNNKITDNDLRILTNGVSSSIEDSWVDGMKVIESDITCKNGYIQKVDGVIESAPNMAEILHRHENMSLWAKLIDRYSLPWYIGSYSVNEATRQFTIDSLYERRFFANNTRYGAISQTQDGKVSIDKDALLKFDPGWNGYHDNSSGSNYQNDAAAMIVPSKEALEYWWEHDGKPLKEEYHDWDSIPELVLSELLNVNMLTSFTESVPSKFGSVLDDANMEMNIKEEHVDSCFIGCNGVIYLTNHVFSPRAYSSVSFPALIHNDVMGVIYWAVKNLDFAPYLNSMESRYSFFIPTDMSMMTYIDPCTFGEARQILYRFNYSKDGVGASRYWARYDAETDTYVLDEYINTLAAGHSQVKNRLNDLMDQLIVVGDVEDGKTYYRTKGGSMLKITNAGQAGNMEVSSGYQIEKNTPLKVNTIYDMSTSGNGKTYVIDFDTLATGLRPNMPLGAQKSVYNVLSEHPEFKAFLNLLDGNDADSSKYDLLVKTQNSYRCANEAGGNKNIRLFEKYNYTIYVPDSNSINKLIADGYLPTWDDYEAQTLEAWDSNEAKQRKARAAIRSRIYNFVRYHIQDRSVYIGGDPVSQTRFESSKLNLSNNRFYTLLVNADNSSMTVEDQLGQKRSVDTASGLYNITCREYWLSGTGTGRSISSASDAVVHYINGELLYDNSLKEKKWLDELDEIRKEIDDEEEH